MIVTQLQELEKSKIKLVLDHEITLSLYQKDIEQLKLEEGTLITEETYHEILDQLLYPRAIQKALSLLKFSDRTEKELRDRLALEDYPRQIIDRVIDYVKDYGYLDEKRFAGSYIRSRMNRKSKLMIKNELLQKGIDQDILDQVLEEEYQPQDREDSFQDPELIAIQKAIAKKTKEPGKLSYEEKQKLLASLYRKGFDLSKIKQLLD